VGALVLLTLAILAGARGGRRITATLSGSLVYGLIVLMVLARPQGPCAARPAFGLANRVTLLRAGIAAVLSAIAIEGPWPGRL